MTPVETAISGVGRAIGSFHPASVPRLSRTHYRKELLAALFLPVMMGAVEGGVVGVVAKNAFAGAVSETRLNFCVAILTGAPAFADITSFIWAAASHARNKIRCLVALQIAAVLLVGQVALAPDGATGLLMLTIGAVGARICWAGVVTIRAAVWGANYPRRVRASLTGKLSTVQAVILASVGLAFALALRAGEGSFHILYAIAAGFGFIGALAWGKMRVRGHAALLASERRVRSEGRSGFWRVLREDRLYRRYMMCMFVFGIGNIALAAPLVILLKDAFHYGYFRSILITTVIPILMMPPTIPLWGRLLDREHVLRFRVVHAWMFVAANAAMLAAALATSAWLLWLGAVLRGLANAGGVLSWNLGHHDFAPHGRSSAYMGVHVTLTGVRGLIGPIGAVLLWNQLEAWRPGAGAWVFALFVATALAGAFAFRRLSREVPAERMGGLVSNDGSV